MSKLNLKMENDIVENVHITHLEKDITFVCYYGYIFTTDLK